MNRKALKIIGHAIFLFFISYSAYAFLPDFGFHPPIEPYKIGFLKVSEIHTIYYELSGNPKGKPVIYLHGGPGTGFGANMRQPFDPEKFNVVLFDQRGCGKSTPKYELRENTTEDLADDIEKLREHLKFGKIMIVGGSWGATLGLAYAEKYPESVDSMVLRAIFLGTQEQENQVYKRNGAEKFFPEVFEKFANEIKPGSKDIDRKKLIEYLQSKDPETVKKYAYLWSWYELKLTSLEISDAIVDKILAGHFESTGLALIQTHYTLGNWFLSENQLLKNAEKLKDIPISLINGRYDMMTPPITAYNLHKLLPKSKLYIVESASHSTWDRKIATQIMKSVNEYGG